MPADQWDPLRRVPASVKAIQEQPLIKGHFKYLFFNLCACVCAFMSLCPPHVCGELQRPEGTGSPATGIAGGCKLPEVVLGTEPKSSAGTASPLNC